MLLSMEWLSEFMDMSDIEMKDYCSKMTMTGSKVEGYEILGEDISNVKVGKILKIEKHPDSDHLLICQIDCGEAQPRQIVTGAQNVFEGAMVPVAMAPAKLPNGVEIKKGKLRGVESNGMLCSIAEMNLTLHDEPQAVEDGIFILPYDCKAGDDVHDVLKLSDAVVEFEITPNRPDCLSVIGLARESGVTYNRPVQYHTPVVKGSGGDIHDFINVEVKNTKLCPRYTARVVKNVRIEPSPKWLRARLRAAGVRPINNIVDITNYVMLEYGQPMHAFDYACLDGSKIIVRNAAEGENFRSLDDIDHVLRSDMLVIADEKKAVALAGVMGGANSEIKDGTETVVFESANFMGSSVRITSRALGMRTESSGRYEKGLDAENTMPAVQRACELVELLGAGEVVDGIIDCYPAPLEQTVLTLDAEKINAFLGVNLSEEFMLDVFRRLEFGVEGKKLYVPSFRSDVLCMNDLAEEVLRIHGYDTIEATPFKTGIKTGQFTPRQSYRQHLSDLFCSYGYNECYTFSFISPKYYTKINLTDAEATESLVIRNPLGEDTSIMRRTILPSVLECLARNNNFKAEKAALFEIAAVYVPDKDPNRQPKEPLQAVVASYGGDFYELKGMMEAVLEDAGVVAEFRTCRTNPTYHPGRCAEIAAQDGTVLAVFGELHPSVAENYGFDKRVYAAVLEMEDIFAHADFNRTYHPLPKYPALTRDLALICDEDLTAGEVEATMRKSAGKLLCDIKLFDVYRGVQVGEGKKSMAFSLSFRADDRTLTDEEADKATSKVLKAVEENHSITIRK